MEKQYKTIKIVNLKMVRESSLKYEAISGKTDVLAIAKTIFENSAIEKVLIIGVDNHNSPVIIHINNGGINQCMVYPSTIFKLLLLSNSASFIICHNHPGDSMTISNEDWKITKQLFSMGKLMEIPLLDHVIFNSDFTKSVSLRQNHEWHLMG